MIKKLSRILCFYIYVYMSKLYQWFCWMTRTRVIRLCFENINNKIKNIAETPNQVDMLWYVSLASASSPAWYIMYLALALPSYLLQSCIFFCNIQHLIRLILWRQDSRHNLLNCKSHNTRIILCCTGCQLSENGTVMKSAKRGEVTVTQLGFNRFWLFAIRQDCHACYLCTQILCQYQNRGNKRWEAFLVLRL